MSMPTDVGAIDTMIGFPHKDMKAVYRFITDQTKDKQSKEEFAFPAEYMFKDVPEKGLTDSDDPIAVTLREMDLWGIDKGLIGVGDPAGQGEEAIRRYPDRFIPSLSVDPNDGMDGVRAMTPRLREVGHPRRQRLPGRNLSPSGDQRQEDVPDLCQMRGARHPHLLLRRGTRSPAQVRRAEGRAHRRGHVRLSGPGLRDPSRL